MSKVVKYSNNDITIIWTPHLCSHAGNCVRSLPKVYRPKERPWVTIENATTEELKKQITTCPSGALQFIDNK